MTPDPSTDTHSAFDEDEKLLVEIEFDEYINGFFWYNFMIYNRDDCIEEGSAGESTKQEALIAVREKAKRAAEKWKEANAIPNSERFYV